jgi:hypothetical protein
VSLVRRAAKRSKYGAIKQTVDGIVFHSKREAKRYCELKLLEKIGEIRCLELQPRYPLYAPEHRDGHVLLGTYVADFRYQVLALAANEDEGYGCRVEDAKGFRTPLYRWKKKHVEAQYGIEIREV